MLPQLPVQPAALPQLEQEEPPAMDEDAPLESRDIAAKVDMMRRAGALQTGQIASSAARLMGRSSSNLLLQMEHLYSYNGIFNLFRILPFPLARVKLMMIAVTNAGIKKLISRVKALISINGK